MISLIVFPRLFGYGCCRVRKPILNEKIDSLIAIKLLLPKRPTNLNTRSLNHNIKFAVRHASTNDAQVLQQIVNRSTLNRVLYVTVAKSLKDC